MKKRNRKPRPATTHLEPSHPDQFWSGPTVPCFLFAAAVLVYWVAFRALFVWDDDAAIIENTLLRKFSGIWKIWTTIGTIQGEKHYWPLTYTVLWLEAQLWGIKPIGFHVVNALFHGAVVVQIWRMVRKAGLPGAVLSALIFAFHPVHVEAVAWVISVKDLIATLLTLIAIEFYMNHHERGGWKWLAWSAGMSFAAMLSKSSPVILPFAIAIWVWYKRGRIAPRDLAGIAGIAAITLSMAIADMFVGFKLTTESFVVPPLAHRIVQSGWTFWFYVSKLVWPVGLSPVYPQWHLDAARAFDWLPLVLILVITVALWFARWRIGRGPLAVWLFYGVSLGPVLGIIYFYFLTISPAADRYQYLPSVAPIVGFGALLTSLIEKYARAHKVQAYAPVAGLLILLAAMTWHQNKFFLDQEIFFRHAEQYAPESAQIHWSLGTNALFLGNYGVAEQQLKAAVHYKPDLWGAISNLAAVYMKTDRNYQAYTIMKDAVDRGASESSLLSNLAWLMASQSDPRMRNPQTALKLAIQCVNEAPTSTPMFLNTLAAAQAANGRTAEALQTAKKALDLARQLNATDIARLIEQLIPLYERGQAVYIPPLAKK